jgi:hypothetical protein
MAITNSIDPSCPAKVTLGITMLKECGLEVHAATDGHARCKTGQKPLGGCESGPHDKTWLCGEVPSPRLPRCVHNATSHVVLLALGPQNTDGLVST